MEQVNQYVRQTRKRALCKAHTWIACFGIAGILLDTLVSGIFDSTYILLLIIPTILLVILWRGRFVCDLDILLNDCQNNLENIEIDFNTKVGQAIADFENRGLTFSGPAKGKLGELSALGEKGEKGELQLAKERDIARTKRKVELHINRILIESLFEIFRRGS